MERYNPENCKSVETKLDCKIEYLGQLDIGKQVSRGAEADIFEIEYKNQKYYAKPTTKKDEICNQVASKKLAPKVIGYSACKDSNYVIYVMEKVGSDDFLDLLKFFKEPPKTPYDLIKLRNFSHQLIRAVLLVTKSIFILNNNIKIFHNDLHPGNIRISFNENEKGKFIDKVWIIDFGYSMTFDETTKEYQKKVNNLIDFSYLLTKACTQDAFTFFDSIREVSEQIKDEYLKKIFDFIYYRIYLYRVLRYTFFAVPKQEMFEEFDEFAIQGFLELIEEDIKQLNETLEPQIIKKNIFFGELDFNEDEDDEN
jgi:serine/threonine protein kinase